MIGQMVSPYGIIDKLGDGLGEELINATTQLPGLRVMARTSAFAFRAQGAGRPQDRAELTVEHILEGSVCNTGNRIRVMAQLVKPSDGYACNRSITTAT